MSLLRVPVWAVAIIVGLLLNLVLVASSWGEMRAKVDALSQRFERLENHVLYGGTK